MQWRKLLLSTVICSGALGFCAKAEAGQILLPNSTWAISKIETSTPGGAPYCALARRFDGDMILTFARNGIDESSFAIDFQKDVLNKTQAYNVKLRSGAGQVRSFDVHPVSGSAAVIRLGKDYAFYDALNRSSRLDVEIAGKSYEFDISRFDEGQQKLNGCLVTLAEPTAEEVASIQPAAGDEAPAAVAKPPGAVSSENLLANEQTKPQAAATSARALEALREENTRLRNALETERRTFEDKSQDGDSNRAAELNEKIRILEKENSDLREKTGSQPAPQACDAQDPAATAALAKNLTALQSENADLKKQVESLGAEVKSSETRSTGDKAALDSAAGALRAENDKLRADLESERGKVQFMQSELDSSRRDVDAARHVAADSDDAALAPLKERVQSLEGENASLQQQVAALSRQPAPTPAPDCSAQDQGPDRASKEIIGRLEAQVDSLKAENDQLRSSLSVAEDKAAQAGEGMISAAQLRAVEDALHAAEAERDSLSRQLETVGSNTDTGIPGISSADWNLEKATRRYNEAEREIRRLATELEQQRGQCSTEKKNIEYMLFDPKIADQQQISKLNELERELAKKDRQLAALQPAAGFERSPRARIDDMPPVASYKVPAVKKESLDTPIAAGDDFTSHGDEMFARAMAEIAPAAGGPAPIPSVAPAASLPPVYAAPVIAAPVIEKTESAYMDAASMKSLLGRAGIDITGDVRQAASGGNGITAYTWQTDQLLGTAEIRRMSSPAEFEKNSTAYLDKTKGRCGQGGEFAAVPGRIAQAGDSRLASYEIACVGKDASASVSVLFFSRDGVFTVISHEASVESMDMAMDIRDRIAAALLPPKFAANQLK